MVATKTSTAKTAKTTKTATKAAEVKAPEKENAQAQAAEAAQDSSQVKDNTQAQQTAGSEQASPAADGGDDGGTKDPQAKPEEHAGKEKAATPPAPEETQNTKRIAVRSTTPGFRRAGFQFSRTDRILDVRKLTDEQLQAIQDEPRLAVRPLGQED